MAPPFLAEGLIHAVLILSLIIFAGIIVLVAIVVGRRIKRESDFKALDRFRKQLHSILEDLLNHTLEYEAGLAALRSLIQPHHAPAVEQILFEEFRSPARAAMLQRLAQDLGVIQIWQRRIELPNGEGRRALTFPRRLIRALGLRFTGRATSAENLGRMQHADSWQLLVRALDDPHPDVQAVALRSLAAIGEPQSFPALVEQLRSALTLGEPGLSERTLKAALSRFPLSSASHLLPLLHDRNSRIRVLAVQVLREMLETEASRETPPTLLAEKVGFDLSRLILTQLVEDQNPDVRAGAADLIVHFKDERAVLALVRLCDDPAWFVRLHAVRALGERGDEACLEAVSALLADSHWRVREAAARALAHCGEVGVQRMVGMFLSTRDAYAREQIAEELQVSGVIREIVRRCEQGKNSMQEIETLAAIIRMGKTAYLESLQVDAQRLQDWQSAQALPARALDAHT